MRYFMSVLAVLVVCVAASSATADLTAVLGDGHGSPFYGNINGQGGYYQATLSGALPADATYTIPMSFRTFCVEDRYFFPSETYIGTVDDKVLQYGPTTLQATTANLYALYIDDAPTVGWNNIADIGSSNRAMQALIWDLQGTFGNGYAYTLLTSAEKDLYNAYNAYNNANIDSNAANVKVLNLWSGSAYTGGDIQSQLIMTTPLGIAPVPAPGAAVLAAAGLGLIGWVKRRFA